jgi:RNA polymerase sigma-70 factor, ECF subfamily
MSLAYRFLGSMSDAEDIVHDAYLRWRDADPAAVQNHEAFLVRIATRLCLDQLKSARVRRETYVGTWLPEPILQIPESSPDPKQKTELADDVSMALLLALERLSPLERAAFLLHDVFGLDFDEIAESLDRSPAACRQLATRARQHVRDAKPRFSVAPPERDKIVGAFQRAVQDGNIAELAQVLSPETVFYSDSGGKVPAARRPILGQARILRLLGSIHRRKGPPRWMRSVEVNGLPGLVYTDSTGVFQAVAFETRNNAISAIYLVRNPDKLAHLRTQLGLG